MTDVQAQPRQHPGVVGRWLRRLVKLLLFAVLLLALLPFVLRTGFARDFVAKRIGASVGRDVSIGAIEGYWNDGFTLRDVEVASPAGFAVPLAQIPETHIRARWLRLVRGEVDATVRVTNPRITIARDAQGQVNTEGLFPKSDAARERSDTPSAAHDLRVEIHGGTVLAAKRPEGPPARVDGLEARIHMHAGGTQAEGSARLSDMRAGGGHAVVQANAKLGTTGAGPVQARISEAVDLARLAPLLAPFGDFLELGGTAQGVLDAHRTPQGDLAGTLSAELGDARLVRPDGLVFEAEALRAAVVLDASDAGAGGELTVDATGLRSVQPRPGAAPVQVQEERVKAYARWHRTAHDAPLSILEARIDAGATLQAGLKEPLQVPRQASEETRARGTLRADLARLHPMLSAFPALASLADGTLLGDFVVTQRGDGAFRLAAGLALEALRLAPSAVFPRGLQDPRLELQAELRQRGDRSELAITRLASRVLRSAPSWVQSPLLVRRRGDQVAVEGPIDAEIDLHALASVWPEHLPPGAATGLLRVQGRAHDDGDGKWAVRISDVSGLGLSGALAVHHHGAGALPTGQADLDLDLAEATPWLHALLKLAPGEGLRGNLDVQLRAELDEAGRLRVVGETQGTQLALVGPTGSPFWQEAGAILRHDVHWDREGGACQAPTLSIESEGLLVRADGAAWRHLPEAEVNVSAKVGGRAERIAPLLQRLLGASFSDLRGQGTLGGAIEVHGPTGDRARSLLVDAKLHVGSWFASGGRATSVTVEATREQPGQPLLVLVRSGLNGGTAELRGEMAWATNGETPWSATATLARVELDALLTSAGPGHWLNFALPALLPGDAVAPAMSGTLQASIQCGAQSLAAPTRTRTFVGKGQLAVSNGSIEKTGILRGQGVTQLLQVLSRVTPPAGSALQGMRNAMRFTSLRSVFEFMHPTVAIRSLVMEGSAARLRGQGTIGFDQRVQMNMDLTPGGRAGAALGRLLPDATIPLRIEGVATDPVVRPRLDLAKLGAGALPGGKQVKDALQDLLDKVR